MKIEGPGKTKGPSKSDKKGGASKSGDSTFSSMINSGAQQAGGAQQSQSIAQVDALLALQGADDPAQGGSRKRMRQRANDILDKLDDVRMAMLRGDLTVGHMIDIADVVASHREKVTDPTLTALMDEVDLRAQVELAKMRQALSSKG